MTKQKIEIEVPVPDGWELTGEFRIPFEGEYILLCERDGAPRARRATGDYGDPYLIIRHAWQWPAWTNLNWLAMDGWGAWSLYENEPEIESDDEYWYSEGCYIEINRGFNFTPPPCTDWRKSKRRRPT